MHTSTLRRTVFLAGMLTASLALADPALMKCVDANGKLTLTNEPCDAGSVAVPIAGQHLTAREPGGQVERVARVEQMGLYTRGQARYSAWAQNPAPAPKHSLDVATLKEARTNLQKSDQAWQSHHPMRLASAD